MTQALNPSAHVRELSNLYFPVKPTPEQMQGVVEGLVMWVETVWSDDAVESTELDDQHNIPLCIRLCVFNVSQNSEQLELFQIMEQSCPIVADSNPYELTRLTAYMAAWTSVLQECVTHPSCEQWHPMDLCFHEVLKQSRLMSQHDFERALVTRGRLGQFLPASMLRS